MGMEMIDAVVRAREIKKSLDIRCKGNVMIRQDKKYLGNQARGVWDFKLFFDLPTSSEKETIKAILKIYKAKYGNFRVIGGKYGYVISFSLGELQ